MPIQERFFVWRTGLVIATIALGLGLNLLLLGVDGLQPVDPAMAPKSSRKGKALQKLPFNDDAIQ